MGTFIKLSNKDIENSLQGVTRQYLAGNLKRPQLLPHIQTEHLEIGLTVYDNYVTEPSHYHTEATEYQYMMEGWTQYMDTDTKEVFEFVSGDFYAIFPGTKYAQKSKPGTKILFIKVPSINDKVDSPMGDEVLSWLSEKLRTVRTDHYYEPNAPQANSIKPAAAVSIINDKDEILLLKRADSFKWTMPGGTLEFGESLVECAIREVREESGLNVKVTEVIGTYTDPNIRVEYSDGEVRQEFTIVFSGQVTGGNLVLDEESTEYRWVALDKLKELELADSQKTRLEEVINFHKNGTKHFG